MSRSDAEEFRRLAERLWGYGYQTRAAGHFEVAGRTVRRWIAGDPIPPRVMDQLRALVHIAPPPASTEDEDRDDMCADAIEPAFTEVRDRAIASGWSAAETSTALLSLAASDICALAGDGALLELLSDLRNQVALASDTAGAADPYQSMRVMQRQLVASRLSEKEAAASILGAALAHARKVLGPDTVSELLDE